MKFRDYVKKASRLLNERPETGDMQVVSSVDDEGNGFNIVNYPPSVGYFDGEYNGGFTAEIAEIAEYQEREVSNAVCIN